MARISQTGLAHSAVVTATNVLDKHPLPQLLHGKEEQLYGECASKSASIPPSRRSSLLDDGIRSLVERCPKMS